MEPGLIEQRALLAACAVAGEIGVSCEQATVAYSGSNVLVHLRPSPVVARVMTGTAVLHEDPEAWLRREVSVLSFLAPSRLAVAPSPLIPAGPYQADGLWMTFWEWLEHRGSELSDGAEQLGRALRELHDELSAFPGELAGFGDLQQDIDRLLRQLRPASTLTSERIDSLRARLFALGDSVFGAPLPAQALHGDASLSNLLSASERLVWNDFEDTFRGPVHWDLAGYLISLEARGADPVFVARALDAYGGVERRELAPFTAAHDVYDEIWGLYDAQRRGPESLA
jgi:aminoglycoside phosphotransferase (APT) family kinase protein